MRFYEVTDEAFQEKTHEFLNNGHLRIPSVNFGCSLHLYVVEIRYTVIQLVIQSCFFFEIIDLKYRT